MILTLSAYQCSVAWIPGATAVSFYLFPKSRLWSIQYRLPSRLFLELCLSTHRIGTQLSCKYSHYSTLMADTSSSIGDTYSVTAFLHLWGFASLFCPHLTMKDLGLIRCLFWSSLHAGSLQGLAIATSEVSYCCLRRAEYFLCASSLQARKFHAWVMAKWEASEPWWAWACERGFWFRGLWFWFSFCAWSWEAPTGHSHSSRLRLMKEMWKCFRCCSWVWYFRFGEPWRHSHLLGDPEIHQDCFSWVWGGLGCGSGRHGCPCLVRGCRCSFVNNLKWRCLKIGIGV